MPKAWGSYATELDDGRHRRDRLEVRPGGYSSRHVHRRMANLFRVLEGELFVQLYRDRRPGLPGHTVRLPAGSGFIVPAGQVHRFISPSGCVCTETAWPWDPDDIERFDTGGTLEYGWEDVDQPAGAV